VLCPKTHRDGRQQVCPDPTARGSNGVSLSRSEGGKRGDERAHVVTLDLQDGRVERPHANARSRLLTSTLEELTKLVADNRALGAVQRRPETRNNIPVCASEWVSG
jgi:hypothetical protein